jgi:hypothetical protein
MAPVIPIRLVLDLGSSQRCGEAPAPHHLNAQRDRVGQQLLVQRRGEIGWVENPQPIGFCDAEKEFETLDLIAAFSAFGSRHGQSKEARPGQPRRGGKE